MIEVDSKNLFRMLSINQHIFKWEEILCKWDIDICLRNFSKDINQTSAFSVYNVNSLLKGLVRKYFSHTEHFGLVCIHNFLHLVVNL